MVEYEINPGIGNEQLNALFADAWPAHTPRDFSPVLLQSLGFVCAREGGTLIGFVNIAWDGGYHAFLLDPTVRSDMQRRGIGTQLVRHAIEIARSRGVEWLHVDYESRHSGFYATCGFRPTEAGLINLRQ